MIIVSWCLGVCMYIDICVCFYISGVVTQLSTVVLALLLKQRMNGQSSIRCATKHTPLCNEARRCATCKWPLHLPPANKQEFNAAKSAPSLSAFASQPATVRLSSTVQSARVGSSQPESAHSQPASRPPPVEASTIRAVRCADFRALTVHRRNSIVAACAQP